VALEHLSFGIVNPDEGGSADVWGGYLNANFTSIVQQLTIAHASAAAANTNANGRLSLTGGTLTGALTAPSLKLDSNFYAAMSGSDAVLSLDSTDFMYFNRPSNTLVTVIGGVSRFSIYPSGADINVPLSLNFGATVAAHATRKDYVDSWVANANANANGRVARTGDTMSGGLTVPVLTVNAADPLITLHDNTWGPRHIHHSNGNLGHLNSAGAWVFYSNNDGHLWSNAYGSLHEYFASRGAANIFTNPRQEIQGGNPRLVLHWPGSTMWSICAQGDNALRFCTDENLGVAHATMTAGGDLYARNNVIAQSDRRLKDNIETITDALSKVEALTGRTYTRVDAEDTTKVQIGLIAQEVQEVVPEVVSTQDGDMLGVSYQSLVPVLIEAIKELSAKVKELEARGR
jgi:hypothetical protein